MASVCLLVNQMSSTQGCLIFIWKEDFDAIQLFKIVRLAVLHTQHEVPRFCFIVDQNTQDSVEFKSPPWIGMTLRDDLG